MSNKYYIVSEEELDQLTTFQETKNPIIDSRVTEVMAAAKSRPIPEWAKLFVDEFPDTSNIQWIGRE